MSAIIRTSKRPVILKPLDHPAVHDLDLSDGIKIQQTYVEGILLPEGPKVKSQNEHSRWSP